MKQEISPVVTWVVIGVVVLGVVGFIVFRGGAVGRVKIDETYKGKPPVGGGPAYTPPPGAPVPTGRPGGGIMPTGGYQPPTGAPGVPGMPPGR